jgi:hypothetical protein
VSARSPRESRSYTRSQNGFVPCSSELAFPYQRLISADERRSSRRQTGRLWFGSVIISQIIAPYIKPSLLRNYEMLLKGRSRRDRRLPSWGATPNAACAAASPRTISRRKQTASRDPWGGSGA